MNKKGGIQESTGFIVILIIAAILLIMVVTYSVPTLKKLFGSTAPLEEGIKKDILEIAKTGTSFLFKEKEKCQQFTDNIQKCITPGTECFWGVFNNKAGCYSCKDNRYFGIDSGKCEGYPVFGLDEETIKLICVSNPCSFKGIAKAGEEFVACTQFIEYEEKTGEIETAACKSLFKPKVVV